MTAEESARQVDWRSSAQATDAFPDQPTREVLLPDAPAVSADQPEHSMMQLSAVLMIILGGMASTFAIAAIIVLVAARG
jgi:hypothetical protein